VRASEQAALSADRIAQIAATKANLRNIDAILEPLSNYSTTAEQRVLHNRDRRIAIPKVESFNHKMLFALI
jgi:hypothetical protein